MHNRFSSIFSWSFLSVFLVALSLFSDVFCMSGELSKERQEWLIKTSQQAPEYIKIMNQGVEESAQIVAEALITSQKPKKKIDELNGFSVKAAVQIASTVQLMSQDNSAKFDFRWHQKKSGPIATIALLNDPKLQGVLQKNYPGKKLNALKKKYKKNEKVPVCARWQPMQLPKDISEKDFWNPSQEFGEQEDFDCSLRRLGIEACTEDPEAIKKQNEKYAKKEENLKPLKEAALVWERQDDKSDDGKKVKLQVNDKDESEQKAWQQFSYSFMRVLHRHNQALVNAAFYERKEDVSNMLHSLYQAQAIKNALFALPNYHEAKDKQSKIYSNIVHPGLSEDLYTVHSFLADKKEAQLVVERPLSKKEWIVFGCKLGKAVLNNPSTIKALLKQDSLHEVLDSEVMKRYVAGSRIHTFLEKSGKWVDFFDNHTRLKAMITPFGRYFIRPTLKGILSFTKHRLESKKEENKHTIPVLQNTLDAYVLALKDEYQRAKKMIGNDSENVLVDEYMQLLFKQAQLHCKQHQIIPFPKEEVEELKKSVTWFASDELLKMLSEEEKKEQRDFLDCINFWLQFYDEKIKQSGSLGVVSLDGATKEYNKSKKDLLAISCQMPVIDKPIKKSRWKLPVPDDLSVVKEVEKLEQKAQKDQAEVRQKKQKAVGQKYFSLQQSKAYHTPEDFLVPNNHIDQELRAFIKEHSDQYRSFFDTHHQLLTLLKISTETFLNIFIKATLNKESEAIRLHRDNLGDQLVELLLEQRHIEEEQENLEKKRAHFFNSYFAKGARQARSFFNYFYSFIKDHYIQWRLKKTTVTKDSINNNLKVLRAEIKKLKGTQEYMAFDQMYRSRIHQPYITDPLLEKKIKTLVRVIDPLFEYALSPEKRSKKQSLDEFIAKRQHRKPFLVKSLPIYDDVAHVAVPRQGGAECAIHALLNGFALCENDINFTEKHLGECRLLVKKIRLASKIKLKLLKKNKKGFSKDGKVVLPLDDELAIDQIVYQIRDDDPRLKKYTSDWLEPVETTRLNRLLLERLHLQKNEVVFITDLSCYLDGGKTINLQEARKIRNIQAALQGHGNYKCSIQLNNFVSHERTCGDNGHYVTLYIEKNGLEIIYKMANSYPEISSEQIFNNFMKVIHTLDFQNVVKEENEEKVADLLSRLDFKKVFIDKRLNQNTAQASKNGIEQNKRNICSKNDLGDDSLVDWILEGVRNSILLTKGKALWTNSGFKDTRAILLDTLDALESAQSKVVKVYKDSSEVPQMVILTNEQKEFIAEVRRAFAMEN